MTEKKQLIFSRRALRRLDEIAEHYFLEGGSVLSDDATSTLISGAERLATLPVIFRPSARSGLREYVVDRFPFILVYRVSAHRIEVVAVLHQRQKRP